MSDAPESPASKGLRLAGPEDDGDAGPLSEPSASERTLWARRGARDVVSAEERAALWRGVERGLARQAQQHSSRRFGAGAAVAGLVAAAAAAFLVLQQRPPAQATVESVLPAQAEAESPAPTDAAAAAALATAEAQSREASRALEEEVRARMGALGEAEARGLERALAPARARLESARLLALEEGDLQDRLRVLSSEARYLRSLSRALRSAEEAAP
jgi:hypothetical protein